MNLYFNEIFMLCLFMILVPNIHHFIILVYIFFYRFNFNVVFLSFLLIVVIFCCLTIYFNENDNFFR